jgi:hypothetical protein
MFSQRWREVGFDDAQHRVEAVLEAAARTLCRHVPARQRRRNLLASRRAAIRPEADCKTA